jgi:hypothetical protein
MKIMELNKNYSDFPNLATFKIKFLAYRMEISCGQILFLESLILDEIKSKIWPLEILTL